MKLHVAAVFLAGALWPAAGRAQPFGSPLGFAQLDAADMTTADPGAGDEPADPDDAMDLQTSEEVANSHGEEPSAALRAEKTFYLLTDTGWEVLPFLATGGAAGYLLTPSLGLEAAYDYGDLTFFSLHAYAQVAAVRVRRFWGNSFYTNTGLARRTLGVTYTPEGAGGSASAARSELVLEASAGNLWQWSWVTFGVDWAGASWPLARLAGRDDFPATSISDETQREKTSVYDRLAGGTTLMACKVWLGVAL